MIIDSNFSKQVPAGVRAAVEVEFVKATYEPGTPKNLPRWFWRCMCGCGTSNGPFATLRAAEADVEATLLRGALQSAHH